MFQHDLIFTRRALGILLIAVGVFGAAGVLLVDTLGAGRDSALGPLQVAGLVGSCFVVAMGLSLQIRNPKAEIQKVLVNLPGQPLTLPKVAIALQVAVLIIYLGYLAIYVNYAATLFRFPFDYDQGEGFELTDTIIHSQGEWPYRNNEQFPFYASNYPPLFHLMAVPLVWVFGPQYWVGRLLSFVMTLVGAAAIGWAVYRDGGRRWWAASIAGLMYLASNYVYHIGPLFRQHASMVTFETLAIVTLAALPKEARGRSVRLWVAMLFLLAAGYTKQLAIWTAMAFFAWLALGGVKRAMIAGIVFTAIAGGIFLYINTATDGYWWLNIIAANVNPYVMEQFFGLIVQFVRLHAVMLTLAVAMLIYELYWEGLSAYSAWFAFSLVNAMMAGKWGAGESYYATSIAAGSILMGLAISRLLALKRSILRHAFAFILPLALIVQARLVLHMPTSGPIFEPLADVLALPDDVPYYDSVGYTQLGHPPTPEDLSAGERIAEYVGESRLPALSEEAGFTLYVGKPVVTNPTQLLNLYNNGLYDPSPLVMMIYDQGFNVVVLRAQFYPTPVLDAIGQAYQPVDDIEMNGFVYHILMPRER